MISKKAVLFLVFILALVQIASAQYFYDQGYGFSGFSLPFFNLSYSDFLDFYNQNYAWVDFFVALALFGGILKKALEDKFGKATPAVLSFVFAIGFASMERSWNFNLLTFGPVAFLIFTLAILFALIWLIHKVLGAGPYSKWIMGGILAILLLLLLGYFQYKGLRNLYWSFSANPLAWGLILFGMIIAMVLLFNFLKNRSSAPLPGLGGNIPPQGPTITPQPPGQPPQGPTTPQQGKGLFSFLSSSEDYKEYIIISYLVNDFINKTIKNYRGDFPSVDSRYKSIGARINNFLNKYQNSKYRSRVFTLANELKAAYENLKKQEETGKDNKKLLANELLKLEKYESELNSYLEKFKQLRERTRTSERNIPLLEIRSEIEDIVKNLSRIQDLLNNFRTNFPETNTKKEELLEGCKNFIKGINQFYSELEKKVAEKQKATKTSEDKTTQLIRYVNYVGNLTRNPDTDVQKLIEEREKISKYLSINKDELKQLGYSGKMNSLLLDLDNKIERKQLGYTERKGLPYTETKQLDYDVLTYVENELDRLRKSYRGRNLTRDEREKLNTEKQKLQVLLERFHPATQEKIIKRNSLLGGLKSEIE
ncbi:hypothetical protein HYX16_04570 [Candidatus Woesearchaeota archaeon]|nr:hypothetical protein [Candidatus Woesearchaeota archaeon]